MLFSSNVFLFIFLPLALLACYLTPARHRNLTLLAASLAFYAWGAPRFVFVLAVSALLDDRLARRMAAEPAGSRPRRSLLALGIVVNVCILIYAKYANFFVGECNRLLALGSAGPIPWTAIIMPVGVSFFTFQKLSYLVDVYRGITPPARSTLSYLLYVALFPKLLAGPIVRYHDVAAQIESRRLRSDRVLSGVGRFCLGLGRKVLVANVLGEAAGKVFGADPAGLSCAAAWLGLACYTFQIYFDFAGYSDMAIGLGRMLGFEFLENFRMPYSARSFTDFWRRWHLSLTNWMREYLYIPLGGNRRGSRRAALNLWIVFLISGFWHGAAWNFITWGAYHGAFLSVERLIGRERMARLPRLVSVPATLLLVSLGWVFFRADDLPHALAFLGRLADIGATGAYGWRRLLDARGTTMLAVAAVASLAPAFLPDPDRLRRRLATAFPVKVLAVAGALALLLLSAASMASGGFSPFIYFRF